MYGVSILIQYCIIVAFATQALEGVRVAHQEEAGGVEGLKKDGICAVVFSASSVATASKAAPIPPEDPQLTTNPFAMHLLLTESRSGSARHRARLCRKEERTLPDQGPTN